jgi:hypothetical protein
MESQKRLDEETARAMTPYLLAICDLYSRFFLELCVLREGLEKKGVFAPGELQRAFDSYPASEYARIAGEFHEIVRQRIADWNDEIKKPAS